MIYTAKVRTDSRLVAFLYVMMEQQGIPHKAIEAAIDKALEWFNDGKLHELGNGWVAGMAQEMAQRLTGEGAIKTCDE